MVPNRLNRLSPSASRKPGAPASSFQHRKRAGRPRKPVPRPCATPEGGSLAAAEPPAFALGPPRMPSSAKVALPHPGRISLGTRAVWLADAALHRAASQPGKLPAPEQERDHATRRSAGRPNSTWGRCARKHAKAPGRRHSLRRRGNLVSHLNAIVYASGCPPRRLYG